MPKPLQHVLCVDDEEDILEIVQMAIGDLKDIQVTCESDVEDALQKIGTYRPDLILLDMMMPKIDGLGALRLFRKVDGCRDIPVVLMTARVQPQEIKEYMESGVTAVIKKPFDPMSLGDEIIKIWDDCPAAG